MSIAHTSTSLSSHAVFIDGDWLSVGAAQGHIPFDYARLRHFLEINFGATVAVHMYLSASSINRIQKFADTLTKLGIIVHTIPLEPRGRSSIDIQLALDATLLPPHIKTFVLVSGDSDFVPLLHRMREAGRRTVLISFPMMLSTLLRDAADDFINLESVVAGHSVPVRSRPPARPSRPLRYRPPTQVIIDKGEHLKPYLIIRKLLVSAKHDVSFFDPYVGAELFELLACLSSQVAVCVITDQHHLPPDLKALVTRFRQEGRLLRIFSTTEVHDRYLRIDEDWWHSGYSFKDLGKRVSQLTPVDNVNRAKIRQIEQRVLATAEELLPLP